MYLWVMPRIAKYVLEIGATKFEGEMGDNFEK